MGKKRSQMIAIIIIMIASISLFITFVGRSNRNSETIDVVFNVRDSNEILDVQYLPDIHKDYMSYVIPANEIGGVYAVLTHISSSGQSEDEYVILYKETGEDDFGVVYKDDSFKGVVQRGVMVGDVLYALIRDQDDQTTILYKFEGGKREEIKRFPAGYYVTALGGCGVLPLMFFSSDDIWFELYNPTFSSFIRGADRLSSFSQYENPAYWNGISAFIKENDNSRYIYFVPAEISANINTGIAGFDVPDWVLPARVMMSGNYLVFTNGYEESADLYYVDLNSIFTGSYDGSSGDLIPKKISVNNCDINVFSMFLKDNILYVLTSTQTLYELDLKKETGVSYKLASEMWGMNNSASALSLYNMTEGKYIIIPFS